MKRYSVQEAARLLGVNDSRVRQIILALIAQGYPSPEKFGGSWVFTKSDLDALRQYQERHPRGRPPRALGRVEDGRGC